MAFYNENLGNRIMELFNYPIPDRCLELTQLFERCSLRELQDIFPTIVQSVFGIGSGGLGWGLRATTKENSQMCFDILHDFFSPMGSMLRLCYRLLNDAIKFEFSLDLLPHKVSEMIQSGQYSLFYADLVNIDPFRRQVTSLLLNAFDYYMLHFVIHATFPLHKMYPAALQVHNERMKTVYFFLTAEYLGTFLPDNPDAIVYPTNICTSVKAPQPLQPVQPLQPQRSPKYLKIPTNTSLFQTDAPSTSAAAAAAVQAARSCESPRTHCWRTESVLHFFVDTWLRYDIDEARDLPSSEFIRVVRILVKQVHTFANSMHMDHTPMAILRKLAHPMMKTRIYPFLKSIIGRWPLDSSLSVVLELWLSYIQPWRYMFDLQNTNLYGGGNFNAVPSASGMMPSSTGSETSVSQRFSTFIAENLVIYTQVFVYILPRFERLDFTSFRNVIMLHRLVKVFNQPNLPTMLCQAEQAYICQLGIDSPRKHSVYSRHGKSEWDGMFHEESYTPLFGSAVKCEIEQVIKTVCISRLYVLQEIDSIRHDIVKQRKSHGFLRKMFASLFEDVSPAELKLQEIGKIPDILDLAVRSLANMFDVRLPEITMEQVHDRSSPPLNFSAYDSSDYLDIAKVTPMQMQSNIANLSATIDPATLPIQDYEVKFLVRFLHKISCRLNEMFGEEIETLWCRPDFVGKLARQLLYPPMTQQWFDKSRGVSELCEERLPARICLRPLASYKVLGLIILSMLLGYSLWHAPIYGLLIFILIFLLYITLLALCV
ncbi:PREDICTED: sphingomyelin phosphodiesterase 4 isoform X1 [Rhagoletis zephyria]|uniref:sphingomyelin phosphodiesterase 4 isoform X1 n=2 Tax=Rhagoletis zephyria TaxID=28612 RepID=UPI000811899C|nr:PREDICTED: sphingomyelin phosphodiesterase 4 isoform X1 [Rhagoletis zephyria]